MATTFATNAGNNDWALSSNGRLMIEEDPVVAAAISLKHKLQFFLGEWFLDTRQGVPYFQVVYVKNPDLELIRRLVRRIILSCPPISNVRTLNVFFISKERRAAFNFEATAEDGRTVTGGTDTPFIVSEEGNNGGDS